MPWIPTTWRFKVISKRYLCFAYLPSEFCLREHHTQMQAFTYGPPQPVMYNPPTMGMPMTVQMPPAPASQTAYYGPAVSVPAASESAASVQGQAPLQKKHSNLHIRYRPRRCQPPRSRPRRGSRLCTLPRPFLLSRGPRKRAFSRTSPSLFWC
jgi:hypothetical protein